MRLWTIVLEISVLMAQFPSREIAQRSYDFRTLGLGYANVGGLLMSSGIPYDSEAGRAICAALSAIMTGICYATSAEMAGELGPFPRYEENRGAMLRVMRNHRRAAYGERTGYEQMTTPPVPLDHAALTNGARNYLALSEHAKRAWDRALALGEAHGYRNAQASVVAPTGTIGLVMDCDTTGIEPDFALVKFKKLAGGGYFKIINRAVPEALRVLGYGENEIAEIVTYAVGHGSIWRRRRGSTTPRSKPRALRLRRSRRWKKRCRPPSTSNSPSTNGRWAPSFCMTNSAWTPKIWRLQASTCFHTSALPAARSMRPTSMSAAP